MKDVGVALLVLFVVGMSTKVAVSRALDYWSATKQLTEFDTLCGARGGTAVRTNGELRCVTCDAN